MRLTVLCSAAPRSTRQPSFPIDGPLEVGAIAAAAALADGLRTVERVLVSPALSARQTAEALGQTGATDHRLREMDYGRWAGLSLDDVAQGETANTLSAWRSDPGAVPHDGESIAALFDRAKAFLADRRSETGPILAISHAGPMRAMAAVVLAAPFEAFWHVDVEPLARLLITSDGSGWRLRGLVNARAIGGRGKL
jgi:broad specificity phosphatase PhoE